MLELWSVGYSGTESYLEDYVQTSTASCFVDDYNPEKSAFFAFDAQKDDLFLVNPSGNIEHKTDLSNYPLDEGNNRSELESKIRSLLP